VAKLTVHEQGLAGTHVQALSHDRIGIRTARFE
jgi:hypothetical protein